MHQQTTTCLPHGEEDASEILLMSCGLAHEEELNLGVSTSCCQQSPRSISGVLDTAHEDLHHFAVLVNGNVEVEITSNLAARLDSDSFGSDMGLQPHDPFTTPPRRRSLSNSFAHTVTTTSFPSHIPFPSPKEMDCSDTLTTDLQPQDPQQRQPQEQQQPEPHLQQDENTKPAPASPCTPSLVDNINTFDDHCNNNNSSVHRHRNQKVMETFQKMNIGAEQKLMRAAASVGIDSLLNAMRLHQDNDRVQRYGCASLQKLASQNGTNRAMIVDAGGVEDILAAMVRHPEKASIQDCGCLALSSLMKAPTGSAAIVQFKGTEVIITALRNHPNHAAVQKHGCLALLSLARASNDCNSLIARLGGVKDLMNALSNHRGVGGAEVTAVANNILEYASAALWSLACQNPKNKEAIESQVDGGLDAVLEALANYQEGAIPGHDDQQHCLHLIPKASPHLQTLEQVGLAPSRSSAAREHHGVDAILSVFVRPLQQQL